MALKKTILDSIEWKCESKINIDNAKVRLKFTIDSTGNVTDPVILKSVCPEVDNQVIRRVLQLHFIPGHRDGKPVNTTFFLPIGPE